MECGREVGPKLCGLQKKPGEVGTPDEWVLIHGTSAFSQRQKTQGKIRRPIKRKTFEMMAGKEKETHLWRLKKKKKIQGLERWLSG